MKGRRIHLAFGQDSVTTVLSVDFHSMLYLFSGPSRPPSLPIICLINDLNINQLIYVDVIKLNAIYLADTVHIYKN